MLLTCIRISFSLLLPILLISCIPSFYPIYKSLIAPHLPSSLRQFFSYLKSLFLTFCSFFLSGTFSKTPITIDSLSTLFSNHTSSNFTQFSLQHWIFLYIKRCDISHSVQPLKNLCSSCSCPSWTDVWSLAKSNETCSVCDICFNDSEYPEGVIGFWGNEHCQDIISEMVPIVDAEKTLTESASLVDVLTDCFSTFLLYVRFFIHLTYRFVVRSSRNFSVVLHYLYVFVEWAVLEIRSNSTSNPMLAITMTFALLVFFFAVISLLRNIFSLVRVVIGLYASCFRFPARGAPATEEKDSLKKGGLRSASPREGSGHHKRPSRILTKETLPLPSWLPSNSRSELYVNQWNVICAEKPQVAKLLRMCSGAGEELDWLGRLLEQLFNGGRVGVVS